jgi:UDP-N-acetylmuramyl pentapeptide synthase
MLFDAKSKIERYLRKNPQVKTIVIAGSYGRKSAIRCLGMILGQALTVTMGVNRQADPDVVLLDYNSMTNFPDIIPDIMVITSCETDAEAREFFALANKAHHVFVNYNDVPQEFAKYLKNPEITTYGDELPADFYFEDHDAGLDGQAGDIVNPDREHFPVVVKLVGVHNMRPVVMACAVAKLFQIDRDKILDGVAAIRPVHGRMSPAKGLHNSVILDDSASTSSTSLKYGMNALYSIKAPDRIVVTDDARKLQHIDYDLLSEVLILGKPSGEKENEKVKYFAEEIDLVNHLGGRLDENCLVLLEIPIPEIIESYLW